MPSSTSRLSANVQARFTKMKEAERRLKKKLAAKRRLSRTGSKRKSRKTKRTKSPTGGLNEKLANLRSDLRVRWRRPVTVSFP